MTTTLANSFLAPFAPRQRQLAQRGPEWLRRMRHAGRERFEELGFPTTRQEDWRTTNVSPIARTAFRPAEEEPAAIAIGDLPSWARVEPSGPRLVFLDGVPVPDLSTESANGPGLWVGNLSRALAEFPERVQPLLERRDPSASAAFGALNTAFLDNGAVVLIDENRDVEQPIQLLFASSARGEPVASHPRVLIAAGAGSRARIVETYFAMGREAYFTNAVSDVHVSDNAHIDHCRIQLEGPEAYHVAGIFSRQGRSCELVAHNINLGGRLVRNDVVAVLDGEGSNCLLNGLYLTDHSQHVDNHTTLDHAKPHCDSREVYKGILSDDSRAIFNGRIVVRPGAQKTDSKQSNPNLLLSDGALAQTRPQLEIYADDVKCTHGATIGRLDEDAVFYLRSRGIERGEARRILVQAFADEVLDRLPVEPVKVELKQAVADRLSQVVVERVE